MNRSARWLLLGMLVLLLGLWRYGVVAARRPSARPPVTEKQSVTEDESLSVYKDPDDGSIRIFC